MKSNPYLRGLRTAVFDIETTGLYPSSDALVLGGIYSVNEGTYVQHFAEELSQEPEVILATLRELRRYDAIITYNGDSFDWPFFERRARKYHISTERTPFQSVDLYRWLKSYWPLAGQLPSLRQKAVEYALGLSEQREDQINGAQSAQLYKNYLLTRRPDDKRDMLLHNRDDLQQLARIADAANFLPYHQIAAEQGFLIRGRSRNIRIETVQLSPKRLEAKGRTDRGLLPASIYGNNYSLDYEPVNGIIDLKVQCEQKENLSFANLGSMPVEPELFASLGLLSNNCLVLKDKQTTMHKAMCVLVKAIIESLFKEELGA